MEEAWKTCQHEFGKWQYAATYGDEFEWRNCLKCGASQDGVRVLRPKGAIKPPHPSWKPKPIRRKR